MQQSQREVCWGIAVIAATLAAVPVMGDATPTVRWWDGTKAPAPRGKLLSDNESYWGERVPTGVSYVYETQPDAQADIWRTDATKFGRRLLNGHGMRTPVPARTEKGPNAASDPYSRVGVTSGPLVVVFDFHRICTFNELDLFSESPRLSIEVEARSSEQEPWRSVAQRTEDRPDWAVRRLMLAPATQARYLRIRVAATEGVTYLNQVLAWGNAEVDPAPPPDAYRPLAETRQIQAVSTVSIPGIEGTALSDTEFGSWQSELGDKADTPAVWTALSTWDVLTNEPILPEPNELASGVELTMARNETEPRALGLVNTNWSEPRTLTLTLSPFHREGEDAPQAAVRGSVRAGGAIASRNYGVGIGPLFAAQDLLDQHLMRSYLTNGYGIARFPELVLSKAGAAVIWLEVETTGAEPGVYEATLSAGDGVALPVRVTVLEVTLPEERPFVHSWSSTTAMFPFEPTDRLEREVAYKQALGISVWKGLPEPGTVNALARERGHAVFYDHVVPHKYVDGGWSRRMQASSLVPEDAQAIGQYVRDFAGRAEALRLGYDDWFGELWDEPGARNAELFGALARLVRKADPRVRIYCNPCFWGGGGVAEDAVVYEALKDWYREVVDVSVPLTLLLKHEQSYALFDSERTVNAFYQVVSQHAKSERARHVQYYRKQPWEALVRGWDGWGYYSYHRPRGSAWDDLDRDLRNNEDTADYQVVYPGPRGPIPTRQSEAMRQGFEDYRLVRLLQSQGQSAAVEQLFADYKANADLDTLHERALRLAAEGQRQTQATSR